MTTVLLLVELSCGWWWRILAGVRLPLPPPPLGLGTVSQVQTLEATVRECCQDEDSGVVVDYLRTVGERWPPPVVVDKDVGLQWRGAAVAEV